MSLKNRLRFASRRRLLKIIDMQEHIIDISNRLIASYQQMSDIDNQIKENYEQRMEISNQLIERITELAEYYEGKADQLAEGILKMCDGAMTLDENNQWVPYNSINKE